MGNEVEISQIKQLLAKLEEKTTSSDGFNQAIRELARANRVPADELNQAIRERRNRFTISEPEEKSK